MRIVSGTCQRMHTHTHISTCCTSPGEHHGTNQQFCCIILKLVRVSRIEFIPAAKVLIQQITRETGLQEIQGSVCAQETMRHIKHQQQPPIQLLDGRHVARPQLHPGKGGGARYDYVLTGQ